MISQTAAHRLLNSVGVIGRPLFAAPSVFDCWPMAARQSSCIAQASLSVSVALGSSHSMHVIHVPKHRSLYLEHRYAQGKRHIDVACASYGGVVGA
eukprot:COSAG03_NODE_146_length_11610_cov_7.478586_6_plen_96_part_00